jgi:hypothetical protein
MLSANMTKHPSRRDLVTVPTMPWRIVIPWPDAPSSGKKEPGKSHGYV